MPYKEYKDLIELIDLDFEENVFKSNNGAERLKAQLIKDKEVIEPIVINGNLKLVDGYTRLSVIPDVIEQSPSFSTLIPYRMDKSISDEDIERYAIEKQIARRNLTSEEIIEYTEILINEDGLTRKKAYQQVAQQIGVSESTIRRKVQSDFAEKERQRQKNHHNEVSRDTADIRSNLEHFSPETIETSLITSEENIDTSILHTLPLQGWSARNISMWGGISFWALTG